MALGAQRQDVLGSIFGEGARLTLAWLAVGAICAAVLSRVIRNLLYGVTANDPLVYCGAEVLRYRGLDRGVPACTPCFARRPDGGFEVRLRWGG